MLRLTYFSSLLICIIYITLIDFDKYNLKILPMLKLFPLLIQKTSQFYQPLEPKQKKLRDRSLRQLNLSQQKPLRK